MKDKKQDVKNQADEKNLNTDAATEESVENQAEVKEETKPKKSADEKSKNSPAKKRNKKYIALIASLMTFVFIGIIMVTIVYVVDPDSFKGGGSGGNMYVVRVKQDFNTIKQKYLTAGYTITKEDPAIKHIPMDWDDKRISPSFTAANGTYSVDVFVFNNYMEPIPYVHNVSFFEVREEYGTTRYICDGNIAFIGDPEAIAVGNMTKIDHAYFNDLSDKATKLKYVKPSHDDEFGGFYNITNPVFYEAVLNINDPFGTVAFITYGGFACKKPDAGEYNEGILVIACADNQTAETVKKYYFEIEDAVYDEYGIEHVARIVGNKIIFGEKDMAIALGLITS